VQGVKRVPTWKRGVPRENQAEREEEVGRLEDHSGHHHHEDHAGLELESGESAPAPLHGLVLEPLLENEVALDVGVHRWLYKAAAPSRIPGRKALWTSVRSAAPALGLSAP